MIINYLSHLILITGLTWATTSVNPVKIRIRILRISVLLFFSMAVSSGDSWIPLLLTILFMGGIIIMFMILSSILPNEKTIKNKKISYLIIFAMFTSLSVFWKVGPMFGRTEIKSFLSSRANFCVLAILVLLYFFRRIGIIASEERPIRSLQCH